MGFFIPIPPTQKYNSKQATVNDLHYSVVANYYYFCDMERFKPLTKINTMPDEKVIATAELAELAKSLITPKDPLTVTRLATLHPLVRDTFTKFIQAAESELNITLRVTHALRTIAEQNALYAQGRTTAGKIVTNAKGGQSFHNFGTAIDVVEMINGKPNWNFDYSKLKPIADRFGIEWGGTWKFVDKPHFQITFGYKKATQLAVLPKDKNGYPIITK